jgi:hypothetical protein
MAGANPARAFFYSWARDRAGNGPEYQSGKKNPEL